MKCLTISPWGDCQPAIPFLVLDNEESGQGLFPLATDLEDDTWVFDVDLMQIAWTDRAEWPLGRIVLREITKKPGCIVRVNLQCAMKDLLHVEEMPDNSAHRAGVCTVPGTNNIISELYFLTPGTAILGENWSFTLTDKLEEKLHPMLFRAP